MILAAHQPNYLPYIGFFHKAMLSDVFVIADHVQYEKKGWQNRNKIRTKDGWMWLTVPVASHNHFGQRINEVKIVSSADWSTKHWRSILCSYAGSPFFGCYEEFFRKIYEQSWEKLADLNETIIRYILNELDIEAKVIRSSSLQCKGHKTDLLIEMCTKLKANTYVSGIGAKSYVDPDRFREEDIALLFQEFHHPTYCQKFEPFLPNMSVIDLLFNVGTNRTKELISKSGASILGLASYPCSFVRMLDL